MNEEEGKELLSLSSSLLCSPPNIKDGRILSSHENYNSSNNSEEFHNRPRFESDDVNNNNQSQESEKEVLVEDDKLETLNSERS
jgi:hypothetical protein